MYLKVFVRRLHKNSKTEIFLNTFSPKKMTLAPQNTIRKQKYDYLLVLDFEATCDDKTKLKPQVSSFKMKSSILSSII